jgi:transposase-like protein
MAKHGPKPKAVAEHCYNLYNHRIRPFFSSSDSYLRTAKGQDQDQDQDNVAINNVHHRSWTREQKLGAVHYALSTFVLNKNSREKLIPTNAAAINIGCTAKMLRTWIQTYNEINASTRGCQKARLNVKAKELQMEQELHNLFLQKRAISCKINLR